MARSRIFVDAKILRRHDMLAAKRSFISYSSKDETLTGVTEVLGIQTDEVELEAVAFAIRDLKDKLHDFTIVVDHQSVVDEIKNKNLKAARKRPILLRILHELATNPSIEVELLEKNQAHRVLNRHLREHPELKR